MEILEIGNVEITDFSLTQTIKIKFHQERTGQLYYRLKCTASFYISSFPTTYLYLGSMETSPQWDYTNVFNIESVKDSGLNTISFQSLFELFPNNKSLIPLVRLEASDDPSFNADTHTSERLMSIVIRGENFFPTWTIPTWEDAKHSIAGITTLTGDDDQKGVQGRSQFDFLYAQATALYGAVIDSYSITITGGYSNTFTPAQMSTLQWTIPVYLSESPNLSGDVTVQFTVEDSRGFTKSFTSIITIIPYKKVSLNVNNTHRLGATRSTVKLDFSGSWYGSPLTLTCTGIKAYKEGQSTAAYTLNPTISISGTAFSYSADWDNAHFDVDSSYRIEAEFTDTVSYATLVMQIPVAIPAISVRYNKVGINNPEPPDNELDVIGTIAQNGFPVMGYVGSLTDPDLNTIYTTGYYYYDGNSTASNFPSGGNFPALLTVISTKTTSGGAVVQRLTNLSTGADFVRQYNGSWGAWR